LPGPRGGSTDRTLEILGRVDGDGRIRVVTNPGRSAPAALNVLLGAARGEIITRVDAHSYVAPAFLRSIVAVMEESGEAVVVGRSAASRLGRLGAGALRLLSIVPVLHFGYGLGFLRGCFERPRARRGTPEGARATDPRLGSCFWYCAWP
jgi:cellulose synthase/poly-beta-1,6-N-acetylglucosamine synthase-like glycosyltransferase